MRKKMIQVSRNALRVLLFLAALAVCLHGLSGLLMYKRGPARVRPFLSCAEKADVLFLGDSQMLNGVFPMELWRDYGIPSYNLSGPNVTMPLSYWVLRNALRVSSPRLVVLGVPDSDPGLLAPASAENLHIALDGWPMSPEKARAVLDLADGPDRAEFFLPLIKYHSRWSSLTADDLSPKPNAGMGGERRVGALAGDAYTLTDEDDRMPEEGAAFVYLRRILELCREKKTGVLLVHMPYPAPPERQRAANTMREIGEEYGASFLDFPRMPGVIDPSTDTCDAITHVNCSGGMKVTDYLGWYLCLNYDLPDRRGDPAFSAWEEQRGPYLDDKLETIRGAEKWREALTLVHDRDFSVCVAVRPSVRLAKVYRFIQNIPRDHVLPGAEEIASDQMFPLWELEYIRDEACGYLMAADRVTGGLYELSGDNADVFDTSFGRLRAEGGAGLSVRRETGGQTEVWLDGTEKEDIFLFVVDDRTGALAAKMSWTL